MVKYAKMEIPGLQKMTQNKKKQAHWVWRLVIAIEIIVAVWLVLEIGLRVYVEMPLKTDFYSSITRELVRQRQVEIGVRPHRDRAGSTWVGSPTLRGRPIAWKDTKVNSGSR